MSSFNSMASSIKFSDYIADFLVKKNIDKVFGMVGGNNALLIDSVDRNPSIEFVNCVHEQAAGFAAEGYARISANTGVSTATSGPGATNLITAIASCYFDSLPVMFITGQCSLKDYISGRNVRQGGFQETRIVDIVKPITKHAVFLDDVSSVRYELEKAYHITQEGRKGPVLIDIPGDFLYQEIDPTAQRAFIAEDTKDSTLGLTGASVVQRIQEMINQSTRPVVLVGGGVRQAAVENELEEFLIKTKIPAVASLMGADIVDDAYPYNLGFIGSHANRYGNLTLANADLILVLGSRLDHRQTGWIPEYFAREAKLIQVDIDAAEINRRISVDLPLNIDLKTFMNFLSQAEIDVDIDDWHNKVLEYKCAFPSTVHINGDDKEENIIVSTIGRNLKQNDVVCPDVGSHQMWVAQSLKASKKQRILFNSGLGAMGSALPTAIGATLSSGKRAIVIAGDGGFQLNIQELELVRRRSLPIKIFILNNSCLGMVMDRQGRYLNDNYVGTKKDYSAPDFEKIADAYGIRSSTVSGLDAINAAVTRCLQDDSPELINIILDDAAVHAHPSFYTGRPMEDLYPFVDEAVLERHMVIAPIKRQQ